MPMTIEEKKARRQQGMDRMSFARRIHRALVNGRPPASEFKTPTAAVTAARVLYSDIERKLAAEGIKPKAGELGAFIAYIPPDLSFLGHTLLYEPGNEAALMESLNGNIILGIVFGIYDSQADSEDARFVTGARPFISTTQVNEWLSELLPIMQIEMQDAIMDRKIQEQV